MAKKAENFELITLIIIFKKLVIHSQIRYFDVSKIEKLSSNIYLDGYFKISDINK